MNYVKSIPKDIGGNALTESPAPVKAQAQYYRDNGVASSVITLTDNTTQIEVGTSGGGGALLRWVPITETAAAPAGSVITTNFDHFIAPNEVRTFAVPRETNTISSIVGANIQNGLYRRVAIKNVVIGSVLTTEY